MPRQLRTIEWHDAREEKPEPPLHHLLLSIAGDSRPAVPGEFDGVSWKECDHMGDSFPVFGVTHWADADDVGPR